MLYYARCDTHYLLYVYDIIRNELVTGSDPSDPEKSLIEFALQRSKETSLDTYTPYLPDPTTGEGGRGWANSLLKSSMRLDGPQFAVYRAVHKWRDDLARKEDENPVFIMPPQTLTEIAKLMPGDPKALWSILGGRCAAKVQQSVQDLFKIISDAKEQGANGPTSIEFLRSGHIEDASLSAMLEREREKLGKPELNLPPVEELRSQKSQLFGAMPISSLWEASGKPLSGESEKLIQLPWTSFVQEAAESAAQEEAQAKVKSQAEAADMIPLVSKSQPPTAPAKNTEMDDTEFTLRQGRKRKLEDVKHGESDSEEGGAAVDSQDMISLEEGQETKAERKARMKVLKKLEKEAKREKKEQMKARQRIEKESRKGAEVDEPDFDYSQAQSILHGQRSAVATNQQDTKKAKAFDPYAARMNAEGAPKPARRLHSERAGKTATFKK